MTSITQTPVPIFMDDGVAVVISETSHSLLAAHSPSGICASGVAVPAGVKIMIDRDVYDGLLVISHDLDRAIHLLCSHHVGHA